MHRLFVALRPSPAIRAVLSDAMGGVAGARWQDDAQLHLTIRFIWNVDRRTAEDVVTVLAGIAAPAPCLRIDGVGTFERRAQVDTLWARIAPPEPLAMLHRTIDRALACAGIAPDPRRYLPHITLARLGRHAADPVAIARWVDTHAAMSSAVFTIDHLTLYESHLNHEGARYDAIARWPLMPT